ncbi:MAG: general secretion pathway protein GspE [Desulfobacteraceae bacterium 4572_87]|nr:MAG: general secretion pathway protein GspE [Desulfobacteraceae bacterium 4572_87]
MLKEVNASEEILRRAVSLQELGLWDKAVLEYESLLKTDYPPSKIIPGMLACLLKNLSPSKVIQKIDEISHQLQLSDLRIAQIKFVLGLETESRGYEDLSLEMYKAASEADPKNKKIKQKITQIVSKLYSGSRYDYLLRKKRVTSEQLQQALALSKKTNQSVEHLLIEQFKLSKEEVGKSLSLYYRCPFRSFDANTEIPVELIGNLKKAFLLHDSWVPMSWGKNGVEILIDDPGDLRKTGQIRGLTKTTRIIFSVGIREDIEKYVRHFFEKKAESSTKDMISELDMIPDIDFEEEEDDLHEEEEDLLNEESSQVVRLVDQVIINAYRSNASDIHIEPSPETRKTGIRFRMDGVCQEYAQVPEHMAKGILSRLKIMAGIDIAERRLPQDGKIKFRRKGVKPFELRLATIPTAGGREDAVLRVLASAGAMAFSQMGLSERNMKIMESILDQPYGMILVVGPTGSGKTTTLHSALGRINKPDIKIWTAEDPVEITQIGLRQVEAKPKIGLDFARIMRSFLRADPDVIMIGEMRDFETASIGVEASLTGHLVFSTLHTNSAPETITRLLDMGLNPLNFSDSMLGVLAQRLLRRLCSKCKKKYHPSSEEFEEIVSEYGRDAFENTGIKYTSDLTLYRPWKCDACAGTGYKGRMGIHELLEGTPEIKRLIKKKANAEEILETSAGQGMTTLKQDGIVKAFSGLTDVGEVRRVCIN